MALNKSDKIYIILILVVLISVLSMKVRPINFRLVLKAITLLFLIAFLYKKDFKACSIKKWEPFNVLKYNKNNFFKAHVDHGPNSPRTISLIYLSRGNILTYYK